MYGRICPVSRQDKLSEKEDAHADVFRVYLNWFGLTTWEESHLYYCIKRINNNLDAADVPYNDRDEIVDNMSGYQYIAVIESHKDVFEENGINYFDKLMEK